MNGPDHLAVVSGADHPGAFRIGRAIDAAELSDADEDLPEVAVAICARRNPEAASVTIGDEVVVYLPAIATGFVLDAMAGLLWHFIDGHARLDEILADIGDVFGIKIDRVTDDYLPVASRWLRDGLIEEVPR